MPISKTKMTDLTIRVKDIRIIYKKEYDYIRPAKEYIDIRHDGFGLSLSKVDICVPHKTTEVTIQSLIEALQELQKHFIDEVEFSEKRLDEIVKVLLDSFDIEHTIFSIKELRWNLLYKLRKQLRRML